MSSRRSRESRNASVRRRRDLTQNHDHRVTIPTHAVLRIRGLCCLLRMGMLSYHKKSNPPLSTTNNHMILMTIQLST